MITYLDYTLEEAINLYQTLMFDYRFIYYILAATVVYGLIIFVNLNTKQAFIITFFTFVFSLLATFYFRGLDLIEHIDTIFNLHFYQNIFFYYWNVIIGILIMHIFINSSKTSTATKFIMLISLVLTLSNLIYSFYISNIVYNDFTLVVGNIAPIVIVGNIILFITYLYLIILKVVEFCSKKKTKNNDFLTN